MNTGDKLKIVGNEKDFHGFEDGAIVEFIREHDHPVYGYMVKGEQDGTEVTVKVLDEHVEEV